MNETKQQDSQDLSDTTKPEDLGRDQGGRDTRIVKGSKKEQAAMPCKPLYSA